ncbi:MAG: antibiotic biosynthesis monooxygenase [Verrucomicrobiota bacterium]|nr:antibiotic biosynthesis monooxygenase [Verrucomicrobiota bacterium]
MTIFLHHGARGSATKNIQIECKLGGMTGVIAVVAYRPKPGKEKELLQLVRERVPTLRKEGLVTDRVPVIMRARDGTIVEVSEWKSRTAIDTAHQNPNVLAMWKRFFAVCDCVPLKTLTEANEMFTGIRGTAQAKILAISPWQ